MCEKCDFGNDISETSCKLCYHILLLVMCAVTSGIFSVAESV